MDYNGDLGCKYGMPHDLKIVHESTKIKVEVCQICNERFRWKKLLKGQIDNQEYLKAHARNFAQKFGRTKRIYHKVYKPEKTKIVICMTQK